MKIAVIGAGAMGSIYASFLAQSNNDVLAIDLWEDHIKAINTNGLRVSGFSGDKTVKNIKVSKDIKIKNKTAAKDAESFLKSILFWKIFINK